MNEELPEDLINLLLADGMKRLLQELDRCAGALEKEVLSYSLDAGHEKLLLLKARAEGGRKVVSTFKLHLEKLRRDALGAST